MFIARMFGRFDFIWSFVAVRPQNRTRAYAGTLVMMRVKSMRGVRACVHAHKCGLFVFAVDVEHRNMHVVILYARAEVSAFVCTTKKKKKRRED